MRNASLERVTNETNVRVSLDLDGGGPSIVRTGIAMYDHLLEAFAVHSGIMLEIEARSLDGIVHHIVEDVAIVLGKACAQAIGARDGIARYGEATIPMDDALVRSVVDAGGRAYARVTLNLRRERIEDLPNDMVAHIISSFASNAGFAIHVDALAGTDDHHVTEAAFKALARACAAAWSVSDRTSVLSTKGVL